MQAARSRGRAALLARTVVALAALANVSACGVEARSRAGAPPVAIENFARVDDGLYRSAQPTPEGFLAARRQGVRTVLNLRSGHDDGPALRGTGLRYVSVPMHAWDTDASAIARALRVATDPALRPVLVHCAEGRDRTGVVVAAYRRMVEGWSADAAVEEMRSYGNASIFANLRAWVRALDVEGLRRQVAATSVPAVSPAR